MKRKIFALILVLCLILGLAGCSNPLTNNTEEESTEEAEVITAVDTEGSMNGVTLKIGVSPDFAPFTYEDEGGNMKGFDIDYIEELSIYLGFDYELVVEQMEDIEKDLKKGKIDCAISGISTTNSRSDDFAFTDTYYNNTMSLVIAEGVEAESKKDIVHMKLGAEKATSSAEYVEENLKRFNNKIKYYDNLSKVFKALEKGKIDAAVLDATSIDYYLENHPESKITVIETNLNATQSSYAIMCGKKFEYTDSFNVAMKQIDIDGKYQEIYNKWFNKGTDQ